MIHPGLWLKSIARFLVSAGSPEPSPHLKRLDAAADQVDLAACRLRKVASALAENVREANRIGKVAREYNKPRRRKKQR